MEAFERLEVWQRSSRLCVEIYKALDNSKDRGFKDQATRSALSVPSNIAEGYERNTRIEYARFLKIAKGSCGELRTQLYIGSEAGFLGKPNAQTFIKEATEITKMLQGLIQKIASKDPA